MNIFLKIYFWLYLVFYVYALNMLLFNDPNKMEAAFLKFFAIINLPFLFLSFVSAYNKNISRYIFWRVFSLFLISFQVILIGSKVLFDISKSEKMLIFNNFWSTAFYIISVFSVVIIFNLFNRIKEPKKSNEKIKNIWHSIDLIFWIIVLIFFIYTLFK